MSDSNFALPGGPAKTSKSDTYARLNEFHQLHLGSSSIR